MHFNTVRSVVLARLIVPRFWTDRVHQSHRAQAILASLPPKSSEPPLGLEDNPHARLFQEGRLGPIIRARNDDDDDDDDEVWFFSFYTTKIGVGNPPLMFTATVDTSWSTLFVPSANCTSGTKESQSCKIHPLYNSSLSSTYQPDLSPASVRYEQWGLRTKGNVSRDSIHVGDMEIKAQTFEEAITMDEFNIFDTALGLSLFPSRSGNEPKDFMTASPFNSMVQQGLLDSNIFSLTLTRNDHERGELVLGGLPSNLTGEDMIEVPLDLSKTDDSDHHYWRYYTMGGWQIPVTNMSISSYGYQDPISVLDTPQIAVISSSCSWIGLPTATVEKIHIAIGMNHTYDWIHCDKRKELSNWTIAFGPHGQRITLSPWDYLIEVYDKVYKHSKCVSAFFPLERYGDKGFIILGQPFLNGLYSVFDADRLSISFANRRLEGWR